VRLCPILQGSLQFSPNSLAGFKGKKRRTGDVNGGDSRSRGRQRFGLRKDMGEKKGI